MPALVAGIPVKWHSAFERDGRDKPGHDGIKTR
jgi:hypothetical protein